ncbi:MAG: hypothetical protein U0169_07915 [Polyangiaceae bacterium]
MRVPRFRVPEVVLRSVVAASFAVSAMGCGYRALYAESSHDRYCVVLVRSLVPDSVASDEVVAGIRATLLREGALADGTGYPRVEVEVLRMDEASEGIAARGAQGARRPEARALDVGVVARAWIRRGKDEDVERDTGDVRAFDVVAVREDRGTASVRANVFEVDDTRRSTARRVGEKLGHVVLGTPRATDESHGEER